MKEALSTSKNLNTRIFATIEAKGKKLRALFNKLPMIANPKNGTLFLLEKWHICLI